MIKPGERYRAWCLSWEDTEDDGTDLVIYDVYQHHEYIDATRTIIHVSNVRCSDASDIAEVYADFIHARRDGWESSWPLTIRVRCPTGPVIDFEVERETVPEFTANEVKPKKEKPDAAADDR